MAVSEKDMAECRTWITENGVTKNTSPAVLLYYEDFLVGTNDLTDEEVGQYIRLLCLQNSKGHLSMDIINRTVPNVGEYVLSKFCKDEDGLYYNERMEYEIYRRVKRKKTLSDNLQSTGKKDDSAWPETSPYYLKELQKGAL